MEPNLHSYDRLFYQYQKEGSLRSARLVLPLVVPLLRTRSVLDVGCGTGAWLAAHREIGVIDCVGIDGDYVERSELLVDAQVFRPGNIAQPFDLGRQFDLVQCLEVAEHVPCAASRTLIDNLTRHGRHILFSAAVPGQGGEDHVNEQPYEFWRGLFAERGFVPFDFLRPRLQTLDGVEPWYRYNVLLFTHASAVSALPPAVTQARVPDGRSIRDFSPLALRLRKLLLRRLPSVVVTRLAVWKHRLALWSPLRR